MKFLQGNLLDAHAEALVNTVNTVGVMGKGIALMFKEAFPANYRAYQHACKRHELKVGSMFVTENASFTGPRWIINFPTKQHWRNPSKLVWITEGLNDLKRVIEELGIRSVALPPLGSGNGGLDWKHQVRPEIEKVLSDLREVDVFIYEPTNEYVNVQKQVGVQELTPARALIAEMVRRYWILGVECTNLEVQKLGWFLERALLSLNVENPMKNLNFLADRYGPYSDPLRHLLDGLDGTYLHCNKRLSDAGPLDTISFDWGKESRVDLFFQQEENRYLTNVLDLSSRTIEGFESPFGMELLATVDWLVSREHVDPNLKGIRYGLRNWPAGNGAAERKLRIFDDRVLEVALERLSQHPN